MEEKKQSLKKQKYHHRKTSQCSSVSISPTYSTEHHSSFISRSPSPNRKHSPFNKANNNSNKQQQFKYRVNSRSPSPVLNFRPVSNNASFKSVGSNRDAYYQAPKQTNRKQLPQLPSPGPTRPQSFLNNQDEFELRSFSSLSNNLQPFAMNQLKTINNHRNHPQTITISSRLDANYNSNSNTSRFVSKTNNNNKGNYGKNQDSDENENWC